MQPTLFAPIEFQPITHSQIRQRELAEQTIARLEQNGETTGLSLEEVEQFLKALAVIREFPSWAR
jgi:hypothetical protein